MIPIRLGQLGYSVDSGVIVAWLKAVGDPVVRGEPLVEIETDKVTIAQEAQHSGRLVEIIHHPDDEIAVGTIIGYLAED